MERTGFVEVKKERERSTVTRCFSKYPLKFIVPRKVGSSKTDAVCIYSLTYGGGIVSGDSISCDIIVNDGCTASLTTQASTKVYKSRGSVCSEQVLEARVGANALLAVIPDPVTCFSTARYSQRQVFRIVPDSSLVVVDWLTSGRLESEEKWKFDYYKSTNQIFSENEQPLFIDTVLLEPKTTTSIVESTYDYQVIAMVILLGPKVKKIQDSIRENVKTMMSEQLRSSQRLTKPSFLVSASVFGPKGTGGVVVRIAAMTTESVYGFLQHQLAAMEPLLGFSPYK